MKKLEIVTIDGPSGAGKSTVGKLLATHLGFTYVDTGAMYRCAALKALRAGVSYDDEKKMRELLENTHIEFEWDGERLRVIMDGEDVSEEIRSEKMGMEASRVSRFPHVREWMKNEQRRMGEAGSAVFDGRDMGTVVFPDARYKFFLTASLEERARRRYREMLERGYNVSFEEILRELKKRDVQDSTREVAPLKKADDAILIDTTGMPVERVKAEMLRWIEAKRSEKI